MSQQCSPAAKVAKSLLYSTGTSTAGRLKEVIFLLSTDEATPVSKSSSPATGESPELPQRE